jgi:hypothetical protein
MIFIFGENSKSVVCANNQYDLEALKQNIREAIYKIQQREFQTVSRTLFKRIQACLACLKEFRNVSQQRADILNIFYDDEYNINY